MRAGFCLHSVWVSFPPLGVYSILSLRSVSLGGYRYRGRWYRSVGLATSALYCHIWLNSKRPSTSETTSLVSVCLHSTACIVSSSFAGSIPLVHSRHHGHLAIVSSSHKSRVAVQEQFQDYFTTCDINWQSTLLRLFP